MGQRATELQDEGTSIARIIGAHEHERARIARELHDAIGQHLAIIANEIRQTQSRATGTEMKSALVRVEGLVSEVSRYIDALSQRLHPAVLDLSGLVPAVRNLCSEFQRREGIKVTVEISNPPRFRNKGAALTLYRIIQEALQNIKKHSKSTGAVIRMGRSGRLLLLTIQDFGVGISAKARIAKRLRTGLGLIGIRERVHLLGGTFRMKTFTGRGTELIVKVPIEAFNNRTREVTAA